jgi:hypothetical protein
MSFAPERSDYSTSEDRCSSGASGSGRLSAAVESGVAIGQDLCFVAWVVGEVVVEVAVEPAVAEVGPAAF